MYPPLNFSTLPRAAVIVRSRHHRHLLSLPSVQGAKHQAPPPQQRHKSPPRLVCSLDFAAADVVVTDRSVARRTLFATLTAGGGFRGLARRAGAGSWWMRPGSRPSPRARSGAAAGGLDAAEMEINGSGHGPRQHREQRSSDSTSLLTLPTLLTLGRVAAVPLLVCTFFMNGCWAATVSTSIFIAAAITDWLDGYIARKRHLGTAFGAFLDPVADKLMVAVTLVLLCTRPFEVATFGEVPWLLTIPSIAIIGREITMSAVREWAASQNSTVLEAVAVNKLGKWKTATQMTALTILLATRESNIGMLVASGVVLLYISAGLAVWSLVVYVSKIWRFMLM